MKPYMRFVVTLVMVLVLGPSLPAASSEDALRDAEKTVEEWDRALREGRQEIEEGRARRESEERHQQLQESLERIRLCLGGQPWACN